MITKQILAILFCASSILASCQTNSSNNKSATTQRTLNEKYQVEKIKVPPGFTVDVYAEVPNARSMCLGTKGTLFVGNRSEDNVYAVVDENKDGIADKVYTIATDLNMPNGVAFKDGSLYIATVDKIYRLDHIEDQLANPPSPILVTDQYPNKTHHGWKFIAFGPDGKLYIPVGAPCNICLKENEDARYASITRMNSDGSDFEVYVKGIRNTVGFDWHLNTSELWFTDNGRDMLGDNLPPDELNRAPVQGLHFGYPFLHGKNILDPEFGSQGDTSLYTKPAQELGPHVAALGVEFYEGQMFPSEYQKQIFIAEHGSWNRSNKIGYRISLVRLEGNNSVSYETFADGWLNGDTVSGRPVDIELMPDGSMLVSDDYADCIYRITYK